MNFSNKILSIGGIFSHWQVFDAGCVYTFYGFFFDLVRSGCFLDSAPSRLRHINSRTPVSDRYGNNFTSSDPSSHFASRSNERQPTIVRRSSFRSSLALFETLQRRTGIELELGVRNLSSLESKQRADAEDENNFGLRSLVGLLDENESLRKVSLTSARLSPSSSRNVSFDFPPEGIGSPVTGSPPIRSISCPSQSTTPPRIFRACPSTSSVNTDSMCVVERKTSGDLSLPEFLCIDGFVTKFDTSADLSSSYCNSSQPSSPHENFSSARSPDSSLPQQTVNHCSSLS